MEEQLYHVYVAYCQFGGGHQVAERPEMESRTIQKLCKECRLLDRQCTRTDVDLIFTRVKARTARKINFEQFQQAMAQIADKKGVDFEAVARAVIMQGGPGVTGVTRTESVRFHDDQSTYTGVYARGGPTVLDPTITLSDLADRTPSDVRGRKIDAVQPAAAGGTPPPPAGVVQRDMPSMDQLQLNSPAAAAAAPLPTPPMAQAQQQQQYDPQYDQQQQQPLPDAGGYGAQPDPELRQWLIDFFTQYNPAKIGNVDVLLQQFAGREEELMNKLAAKYNVPGLGTNPMPAQAQAGVGASPGQFSAGYGGSPGAAGAGSPAGGAMPPQAPSPSEAQGRGRGRGGRSPGGGSIFDRLTDSSQYTGAHKHRFDAQGRGRGLAGRDPISKGGGSGGPVRSGVREYTGSTNTGTDQNFSDASQFLMRR